MVSLEYLKRLSALALVLSILLAVPFSVSLEQAALADAEVTIQQKIDVEDDSEEKDSDDDSGKSDKSAGSKKHASAADKKKEKAGDEPKLSVTEHTVIINGQPVKYRATAGYMVLKDYTPKSKKDGNDTEKDKAEKEKELKTKDKGPKSLAKMFFIAYTREDVASTTRRPVTFSFNGGPGSASVWLHMGGLGPRRASLTDRGEALPPPYRLEDNNYSWLDESDLVFIDPVSTGYSRAEIGEDPKKFHGYQEDIESVGDFIRLYLTKYKRWMSPKFIVGESYGTTRAAGLSDFLQSRYGIYLNGIVLVSAVLNFQTIDFSPGNDTAYALFLPTFAATAWYHKKLPAEEQSRPLSELLSDVEHFASHDYLLSLFKGDGMSKQEKDALAARLSEYTGLSAGYIDQLGDRVTDDLFFTHLLADRNRQLGRYDSRFTGIAYAPGTDKYSFDPSAEAVTGPFTATFNDYVRRELRFESELPYETIANVWPWNMKQVENRYLNVAEDLRRAMSRNPYLKVWVCCGHYDLATPYFASKYTVDQMNLDPAIRHNIRLTYYDSGHMLYINKQALQQFKSDFRSFAHDAMVPDSGAVPSALP